MKHKRLTKLILAVAFVSALPFFYNNCSKHDDGSDLSSNAAFKSCEGADELSLFSRTYHPFMKNKCSRCHFGGGAGPGSFASASPENAFDSFLTVGPSRIADRALDGHSSASGPENTTALNDILKQWESGIDFMRTCQNDLNSDLLENQDSADRIQLRSKAIGFLNDGDKSFENSATLVWDLSSSDVIDNPLNSANDPSKQLKKADFVNTANNCENLVASDTNCNVKLKADVGLYFTGTKLVYLISRPRIETYGIEQHVHIESLLFKLNGKAQAAQRAFVFANRDIRAWNPEHPFNSAHADFDLTLPADDAKYRQRWRENFLISSSSLVIDVEEIRTTDVLSVSIGKLHKTTLPKLSGLPIVRISAAGAGTYFDADKTFSLTAEDAIPDPLTCVPQPDCALSPGVYTEFEIKVSLVIPPGEEFNELASVDLVYGNQSSSGFVEECCSATQNFENDTVLHDYFNRDIEQINGAGVRARPFKSFDDNETNDNGVRWHLTFLPGETEKIIKLRVVPDDRDENSGNYKGVDGELVHFQVINASLSRIEKDASDIPMNNFVKIFIPDNDVPPLNPINTYETLMKTGGVLRSECVRCHNSIDARGGYDMTNYWQMVEEGILRRGGNDISYNSLMYQRMNPDSNASQNLGLQSMPPGADGGNNFLSNGSRASVTFWLRDNAAHND